MRIVERTEINRPIEKVWPHIICPEDFQKWNKKVVSMGAKGEFRLNQPFVTHYVMSKKPLQCQSMVTRIEPGRILELLHTNPVSDGANTNMECIERFTLTDLGGKTLVVKEINVKNSGIPWYWMPLIWFITRFGKPKYPDELKQMCEQEA